MSSVRAKNVFFFPRTVDRTFENRHETIMGFSMMMRAAFPDFRTAPGSERYLSAGNSRPPPNVRGALSSRWVVTLEHCCSWMRETNTSNFWPICW